MWLLLQTLAIVPMMYLHYESFQDIETDTMRISNRSKALLSSDIPNFSFHEVKTVDSRSFVTHLTTEENSDL